MDTSGFYKTFHDTGHHTEHTARQIAIGKFEGI